MNLDATKKTSKASKNDIEQEKQEARLAAQKVSKDLHNLALYYHRRHNHNDDTNSSPSNDNFLSRNSMHSTHSAISNGHDDNSVATSNHWKRKRKIPGKKRKMKDYSKFQSDDASVVIVKTSKAVKNAFMCTYCGEIFSSESYASVHERFCIKHGISSLTQQVDTYKEPVHVPIEGIVRLSPQMQQNIIMTDEALCKAVRCARKFMLTKEEVNAECELAYMARDRAYYDALELKSKSSEYHLLSSKKKHLGGIKIWSKLQNKLTDAYILIKEGDHVHTARTDKYKTKNRRDHLNGIKCDDGTMYINVIVKPSAEFIYSELDRLAKERWKEVNKEHRNHFELVRNQAQLHALKLAKFSFSPDIAPEKIAVTLSNDLCRDITEHLKRSGVEIETDIEYRKGPYFILSVNVVVIDWIVMLNYINDEMRKRKDVWSQSPSSKTANENEQVAERKRWRLDLNSFRMTKLEVLEQVLAWLYHLNWTISVPLCCLFYNYFLKCTINRLVLTSVTGDFFEFGEKKKIFMDIEVTLARHQAAFMLGALQHMRNDEFHLNKKKEEAAEGSESRGPLLGPILDIDSKDVEVIPEESLPANFENVVFESELPVGYYRLRRALLIDGTFFDEALFQDALNYTEITIEDWDNYQGSIGEIEAEEGVDENDFIGAKKKTQYLMPKSAFVGANMAYEESELIAYNKDFFSVKRRTQNPDVPYGKTFCAWTQFTVYNQGPEGCKMICSVEAEFPNGEPMVARSIKNAMKNGVGEMFLKLGESILKYADVTE